MRDVILKGIVISLKALFRSLRKIPLFMKKQVRNDIKSVREETQIISMMECRQRCIEEKMKFGGKNVTKDKR